MILRVGLLAAMASVFSIVQAAAVVLTIDGAGQLTGATDVDVNGSLFDVQFLDGSCVSIFSGCNEDLDFTFTTEANAQLAGQALLDQVFLDSVLGNFDSNPALINGCQASTSNVCSVLTPYSIAANIGISVTQNIGMTSMSDLDSVFISTIPSSTDTGSIATTVFAVFSSADPVSEVPGPAALPLFLLGLAGLSFVKQRRKGEAIYGV